MFQTDEKIPGGIDPLRELLGDEVRATGFFVKVLSDWESFVAGDGNRSIRRRDQRTTQQVANDLLSALRGVAEGV